MINRGGPVTTPAVISPDQRGLQATLPNGMEDAENFDAGIRFDYQINNSVQNRKFQLRSAELVVSGSSGNGFFGSVAWRLPDDTIAYARFNDAQALTDGSHVIEFSTDGLVWTAGSSPLKSGANFRLIPYDLGKNERQGVIETFNVWVDERINTANYGLKLCFRASRCLRAKGGR